MKEKWKQLRPDHKAWLHAKLAFVTWAVLVLIYTPARVEDVLGRTLVIGVCSVIIIGILLSVYGLFMSLSIIKTRAAQGVRIELAGLWLAMAGPFSYMVTQIYILTQPEPGDRTAQVALCWLIMAFLYVRIVIIASHRKRQMS